MNQNDEEIRVLDEKLRGAGLLEDGLSLQDKRQLCDFLADSCSSAEHEEQKRQQQHQYDPTRQQQEDTQQLSEQENAGTLDSLIIEEIQKSDDININTNGGVLEKRDPQAAGSSNQLPPRHLSQDVDFFDSPKCGSDQSVETLSQSLIPSSNADLNNMSSSQQRAYHIPSNIEALQSNEGDEYDQNVSSSEKSSSGIGLHTKSSEQENVLINSNTSECVVPSGSYNKLPLEDSEHELSMNLQNNSKVMDSFKDEMNESDCHLHLEQSKNTTVDESCKDGIAETATGAVVENAQDREVETQASVLQANEPTSVGTLVGLVQPCLDSCNGTDVSNTVNNYQVIDIYACLPSIERIKLYSKRKDEINIQRAALFRSAPPEVQKQILNEVLVSLTKTSNQFSKTAEQPHAPIMWTRVITVVARNSGSAQQEGTTTTTVAAYSLRRRRNQQPSGCVELSSVDQDLDDLDDILPDVDIDQRGNDGDWLPALKTSTKKRQPAANKRLGLFGARPRERGAQPQIECQESDEGDDAFEALIKKPFYSRAAAKDNSKQSTPASNLIIDQQVSSSSSTSKRKSFSLQIDKALTPSLACKENQRKFQRSNSPVYDPSVEICKTSAGNKDDALSDNDIVEIDVVGSASVSSSLIANSTPKSHAAANMSSSSTSSSSVSSRGHVLAAQLPYINRAGPSGVVRNSSPGAGLSGVGVVKRGLVSVSGGSGTVSSPLQEQRPPPQKRREEGDLVIKPGPLKLRGLLNPDQSMSHPLSSGCASSGASSPAQVAPADINLPTGVQAAQVMAQQKRNLEGQRDRREQVEQQLQRQHLMMNQKQQHQLGGTQKQELQNMELPDVTPEETIQCPICALHFPILKIEYHASSCEVSSPNIITTRQKGQHHQGPSSSSAHSSSGKAIGQKQTSGGASVDSDDEIFLDVRTRQRQQEASSSAGPSNNNNNGNDTLGIQVEIIGSSGGISNLKAEGSGIATNATTSSKRKFAELQQGRRPLKPVLTDSDDEDDDCVSLPVVHGGGRGGGGRSRLENCGVTRCRTPEGEMRCHQCLGSVPKGLEYSQHVHFHCPALAVARMIAPSAKGMTARPHEQTKPRGRVALLVPAPSPRHRLSLATGRPLSAPAASRTIPVIASTSSSCTDEEDVSTYYRVPDSPPRNMTPASQQTDSCIDYGAQYSKANLPMNASRRGRGRGRGLNKRGRKRKRSAAKESKAGAPAFKTAKK